LFFLTLRPISDIDLPDLPDFLKPSLSTMRPLRPIQDIDLPDGTGILEQDEDAIKEENEHKHEHAHEHEHQGME
jgi:ABC-type Zn2+ transport system substrate-binding protein/surface adhesin